MTDDAHEIGPFRLSPDCLSRLDANETEVRICDFIKHVGNAARADGTGAADLLQFRDRNGTLRERTFLHQDSALSPGTAFLKDLLDTSFAVPAQKQSREYLLEYLGLCRAAPASNILLVQRMGHNEGYFVLGDEVISAANSPPPVRLIGPLKDHAGKFGQAGSLQQYQDKVLKRCARSSTLMCGVAAAALAPLMKWLGMESGGLNLVGSHGMGKTTALWVVGSIYGGGAANPYVVPFHMTDNAPETLGLVHCDLPLVLDELDALEADPVKAGGRLKAIVHRLSVGQTKATSHRAPKAHGEVPETFCILFLTSSEHRLSAFMREGGSKLTGGQAVRLSDLPVDAGKGLKIFESVPSSNGTPLTADEYLVWVNRACRKYYGVAGRAYLRRLLKDHAEDCKKLHSEVRRDMEKFEREVASHPHVDHRIRRRFAALYAAGQLLVKYDIVPKECDRFMEAISTCYRAAIGQLPKAPPSKGEVFEDLFRFWKENRRKFLDTSAEFDEAEYEEAFGLVSGVGDDKRVFVKASLVRSGNSLETFELGKRHLVEAGVLRNKGQASQKRVPGISKRREYFYGINLANLKSMHKEMTR
jgi:putative DNA primase/helicase